MIRAWMMSFTVSSLTVLLGGCSGSDPAEPADTPEPGAPCQPGPARRYEFELEGVSYYIEDGDLFTTAGDFVDTVYDPDYYDQTFAVTDGRLWLRDGDALLPIHDTFVEDFEPYTAVRELFPADGSGWHHITVLSPAAHTADDSNALSECVIDGTCDFQDNRLDLTSADASGDRALRFHAVAATPEADPSKMSIRNQLFCFAKGDDVWLSFRAFSENGTPGTLADIESTFILGYAGPRITLYGGGLGVELKWVDKPVYRQAAPRPWPVGVWVDVALHLVLDDTEAGVIQLWQDGELVIDTRGQNLPLPDIVLDSLEVGISATIEQADLLIDDLRIGRQAPPTDR